MKMKKYPEDPQLFRRIVGEYECTMMVLEMGMIRGT